MIHHCDTVTRKIVSVSKVYRWFFCVLCVINVWLTDKYFFNSAVWAKKQKPCVVKGFCLLCLFIVYSVLQS